MKLLFNLFFPLLCSLCLAQNNIETKFAPPVGYERVYNDNYSKFLRQFPLKSNNVVKYYDGETKFNNNIWSAVFDYDIGNTDLHQCADAAIYMRANFLHKNKMYDKLHFNFTSGFRANYTDWLMSKYRVKGNKVWLEKRKNSLVDNQITHREWLKKIWMYAGTYSVGKFDTKAVNIMDMKPGDLFVQGGFPGHIISVVDMAKNKKGHTVYMLAQSYMPAQEHQILKNPKDRSVWYHLDESEVIQTPEYTFRSNQLRRFNK